MSLTVPQYLVERVQTGETVSLGEYIEVVRGSLPLAWSVVEGLVARKRGGEASPVKFDPPSLDDGTRGQLLRMFASDATRAAISQHFGVALAFQNCHSPAMFLPDEVGQDAYRHFVSPEAQLLNQRPENVDC